MNRPQAILFDAGGTLVTMDPAAFGDVVEPVLGTRPDPDRMITAHYQAMGAIGRNSRLIEEQPRDWWRWWLARFM